ncbi:hypothetical protein HMPREF1868_01847 [Olsenella sp. DNF00959]|nr:hypothetical protein HMPREF1868_01847 [Olsenella sp. DNF00959]
MTMGASFRMARAMETRCASPPLTVQSSVRADSDHRARYSSHEEGSW